MITRELNIHIQIISRVTTRAVMISVILSVFQVSRS